VVPSGLPERVRLTFLLLGLAWSVMTVTRALLQEPDASASASSVGVVLLLDLVVLDAFRRGRFTLPAALVELLAITAGVVADGPNDWVGGCLYGLVFVRASLTRGARGLAGLALGWTAAAVGGAELAARVGRPSVPAFGLADTPTVLATILLLTSMSRLVTVTVSRYDEAVARERALLSVGTALVASGSPDEIGAVAVRTATALLPAGAHVRWLDGTDRPARPTGGQVDVVADAEDLARVREPLGLLDTTGWVATLAIGAEGHDHLLVAEAPEPPQTSAVEALGALASALSAGLQAVAATESLRRQALQDPLTGLANRAQVERSLADAAAEAAATGHARAAVLLVDLDGFKQVNDRLGHAAGDAVLVTVAARLRECTRPGDLAARLGGDEFVLLVECPGQALAGVADRVTLALAAPIVVDGVPAPVTGSVGVAAVEPGLSPAEVLRRADTAMYQAKAAGKATYVLHAHVTPVDVVSAPCD
jgi:diguanylate cyclase (GGDEF)-like protein